MRAIVQRVNGAQVSVDGQVIGQIRLGVVVLLGVGRKDNQTDASYLANKIVNLRIFEDESGKMNRSLLDIHGQAMIISQFTLYGDCRKGRRPDFTKAAQPGEAKELYLNFVDRIKSAGISVATGEFGATMLVRIDNYGPVTLIVESEKGETDSLKMV